MAKPRQVRRASEQADELHKQAYSVEDATPVEEPVESVEPEPAPVEVPAEPPVEAVEPEPAPEPQEDWEQKYRVLQGKYNAEVPRFARENRELKEQLDARTQILAGLERVQAEPAVAPQAPTPSGPVITEAEREDYGSDFLDVVGRQAQLAMAPQLNEIQRTLQQMNSGMGTVTQRLQQSDQDRVYTYLDAHVPDWQKVNEDDAFLTWLAQKDRYTGRRRQDLLAEAFQQFDAPRVAVFFTDYQQENAVVTPAPEPAPTPAPNGSGKVPLTQLVAPGAPREGAGAAGAQDGKRTWTQAQIAEFYTDVQRGRYRDNAAEKLAIEKDIVAAGTEGRIIG